MHTFHVMPLQVFTNNLKIIIRYISCLWLFLLQESFSCSAADITDKAKVFIATVCVFSCMSHMIKYPQCWTVGTNYCSKQNTKTSTNNESWRFFSINIITNKLHTKLYAKKVDINSQIQDFVYFGIYRTVAVENLKIKTRMICSGRAQRTPLSPNLNKVLYRISKCKQQALHTQRML